MLGEGTNEIVAATDAIGALLVLLGPGSDFVTGQNIWVNGGRAFN